MSGLSYSQYEKVPLIDFLLFSQCGISVMVLILQPSDVEPGPFLLTTRPSSLRTGGGLGQLVAVVLYQSFSIPQYVTWETTLTGLSGHTSPPRI